MVPPFGRTNDSKKQNVCQIVSSNFIWVQNLVKRSKKPQKEDSLDALGVLQFENLRLDL